MNVKEDADFLLVYSAHGTPVIRAEIAEFIESSATSARSYCF